MSEHLKPASKEKLSSQFVTAIGEQVLNALRGNRLTLEAFVFIVTMLLSFTSFAQEENESKCDPDKLSIMGEDLLPPEIDADEIRGLYTLVCQYLEEESTFEPEAITLDIQPVKIFGEPVNDIAYTYATDGIGYVGVAAGDTRLTRDGVGINPSLWRMILPGHEFPHMFGDKHGLGAKSLSGVHQTAVGELVQGMWDVYWWELAMQYASANRCDLIEEAAQSDPELAVKVCEEAAEIMQES